MITLKLQPLSRARKLAALVIATVLMASCGGGGGGASVTTILTNAGSAPGSPTSPPPVSGSLNALPIVIDAGPVSGESQINVAYVTVTVCVPETTSCQTIDHVTVDTGSSGLRLLKSELYSSLNLPQVTSGGSAIGECVPFVVGATWGSVRYADIYLNGEVARNVPIQDIGDTPGGAARPDSCSAYGNIQDTQAALGSNGILGVGLFQNDCDLCLTTPIGGAYYTCNSSGCQSSTVTAAQVVQNPVALFAQDNNGVLISLPAVTTANENNPCPTSTACSLIFGIGTESNNGLGNATVYATDPNGNFTTTYYGTTVTGTGTPMTGSYIDSGSNGHFFNDSTITQCSGNTWYCPTSAPLALNAINAAATGTASGTVTFSLVNADQLFSTNAVAGNIGGPGTANTFDWGLPFFFGRPVFTAISGASAPVATGPYFAY